MANYGLQKFGGGGNFLTGYDPQLMQAPIRSPGQIDVMNQLLPALQQRLQQGGNFQGIEQKARRDFQTKTVPGLAERFTAMGGGQNSSAFQGALGSAASDLETNLAALGSQYGLQQQGLDQNLLQLLLQPQHENLIAPQTSGLLGGLSGGLGYGLGQGLSGGSGALISLLLRLLAGGQQQAPQANRLGGSSGMQQGVQAGLNLIRGM